MEEDRDAGNVLNARHQVHVMSVHAQLSEYTRYGSLIEGHGDLSYRDIGIQVLLVHLTIHMLALVNLPTTLSGMRVQIRASR